MDGISLLPLLTGGKGQQEHDLAEAYPERVATLKELMREAHVPNPDFPVLKGE